MTAIDDLERIRIVPVVVLDDAATAPGLASALAAGGVGCAEITLRTGAAVAAIEAIALADPGFIVGAGTVMTPGDVDRVADAGARFVVSPGFDDAVVARARERGMPIIPGVATATEVQRAAAAGLDHVKFFPAEPLGGTAAIEALAGPFAGIRFLPSGGVTAANAAGYLACRPVFAVSGSWMAPRDLVEAHDWDEITRLSSAAATLAARRP